MDKKKRKIIKELGNATIKCYPNLISRKYFENARETEVLAQVHFIKDICEHILRKNTNRSLLYTILVEEMLKLCLIYNDDVRDEVRKFLNK